MLNLIDADLNEQVYVICYRISRCEFYAPVVWTLASLKANMLCKMAPGETDVHLDLIAGVATAIRKCALAYRSICCRTHTAGDQLSERFIAIASHRMVNSQSHRENREVQCNCQPQDGEQTQRVTEGTERFTAIACSHSITGWCTPPGPTSADCGVSDWSNTKWSHLVSKMCMWCGSLFPFYYEQTMPSLLLAYLWKQNGSNTVICNYLSRVSENKSALCCSTAAISKPICPSVYDN